MIDRRATELLKSPEKIQKEDLQLLENEIAQYPYIQSLRGIYLYGIHRYKPEDFKEILTATAAYTTDKKILYRFINKDNSETKQEPAFTESPDAETFSKEVVVSEDHPEATEELVQQPSDTSFHEIEPVADEIQEEKKSELSDFTESPDAETFSKEVVVSEDHPEATEELVQQPSDTSFHEIEPVADEIQEEKKPELSDFTEIPDAETFSKEVVVSEDHPEAAEELVQQPSETSFHEIEPVADEIQEEKKAELSDFTESADADTFSKEVVVSEDHPEAAEELVQQPSETSFHEIEPVADEIQEENKSELSDFTESPDAETFTEETNVNELHILEEEKKVENSADLSFHGVHEFMPDIQIPSTQKISENAPVQQSDNRHEDEMMRLIAEVEAKMKAAKKDKIKNDIPASQEEMQNCSIDFVENFENSPAEHQAQNNVDEHEAEVSEVEHLSAEVQEESVPLANPEWKPMSDIGSVQKKVNQFNSPEPEILEEERPVLNVSFFSEELKPIEKSEDQKSAVQEHANEKSSSEKEPEKPESSNVPHFITTWQNWLKLDKGNSDLPADNHVVNKDVSDEEIQRATEKNIDEKKQKAIETFLETNPKISRSAKDGSFSVKEKEDDISHLMTETLARIYADQKLYSKAIAAYETLIDKHPDKTDFYQMKIDEIKEMRTGR